MKGLTPKISIGSELDLDLKSLNKNIKIKLPNEKKKFVFDPNAHQQTNWTENKPMFDI